MATSFFFYTEQSVYTKRHAGNDIYVDDAHRRRLAPVTDRNGVVFPHFAFGAIKCRSTIFPTDMTLKYQNSSMLEWTDIAKIFIFVRSTQSNVCLIYESQKCLLGELRTTPFQLSFYYAI